MIRVAVEPEPGAADGAPGNGLFHEGTGHQRHLVQEYPRKGDALNQGGGGFVLSSEQIEPVAAALHADVQVVFADLFDAGKAQIPQHFHQGLHHIPLQGGDGSAADGEALSVKGGHGPADKPQGHGGGFAAADCPVTDDGVVAAGFPAAPPAGGKGLLFGKGLKLHLPHPLRPRPAPPAGNGRFRRCQRRMHIHTSAPAPAAGRKI